MMDSTPEPTSEEEEWPELAALQAGDIPYPEEEQEMRRDQLDLEEGEIDLTPQFGDMEELEQIWARRIDSFMSERDNQDSSEGYDQREVSRITNPEAPGGFILGLQEFNWNAKTLAAQHLKGHLFHTDKTAKPYPRAGVFASSNLDIWGVPRFTNRDMATVVWLVKGMEFQKVYLVSCYHMDNSNNPDDRDSPVVDPLLVELIQQPY